MVLSSLLMMAMMGMGMAMASWALRAVTFDDNDLVGLLPDALMLCEHLRELSMSGNSLTGPIPDGMSSIARLEKLGVAQNKLEGALPSALALEWLKLFLVAYNELSGTIPSAVLSWIRAQHVVANNNHLTGHLPDEKKFSMRSLGILDLKMNKLAGAIPDEMASHKMFILNVVSNKLAGAIPDGMVSKNHMYLGDNFLSGPIPEAAAVWTQSVKLEAACNTLTGRIPDGAAAWTELTVLELYENQLAGPLPDGVPGLGVIQFWLQGNMLSGSLPIGLASRKGDSRKINCHVEDNKLSGSMPAGVEIWRVFSASNNNLSGSLSTLAKLPRIFVVSNNRLTGSLPSLHREAQVFVLSGNMLEGTIPPIIGNRLKFVDVSGRGGQLGSIQGPLPFKLGRSTALHRLALSNQNLEDVIPPFAATLSLLALQNNALRIFSGAFFSKDAVILLHNNHLSCHLPVSGSSRAKLALCGLGNELRHQDRFPPWVSPMERDSLFWTSALEDLILLTKAIVAISVAGMVMVVQFDKLSMLRIMTGWRHAHGRHRALALALSTLTSCIAHASLVRVLFLLFLPRWDLNKCPRPLAVVSTCMRGSIATHSLALALWYHFSFFSVASECLIPRREQTRAVAATNYAKSILLWSSWLLISMSLSVLSAISQAARSVPSLLGSARWSLLLTDSLVGFVQGVLSSIVLPCLAQRLTRRNYVLVAVANLMKNCFLPAAVVIWLDSRCLGNWVALWRSCRKNAEQFQHVFICNMTDRRDCGVRGPASINPAYGLQLVILRKAEVCNQHYAGGHTSVARCAELTLFRLQDIWLGKIIAAGLLIPAAKLGFGAYGTNSNEVVAMVSVFLVYAMFSSGHLPLVVILLLLAMMKASFLAAVSWDEKSLLQHFMQDIATPCILLTRASSTLVHLGSASQGKVPWGVAVALVILTLGARGLRPKTSSTSLQENQPFST